MILLALLRIHARHISRLSPASLTITPHRWLTDDQHFSRRPRPLLASQLPVLLSPSIRWRKLKFSFGYTNYGHRRHIRPPGHHVSHYFQFFLVIIAGYAVFYLT